MGSRGSSNPWPPYSSYSDCSLGICSLYCPQWCYIVFPPPPPSGSGGSTHTYLSPLVIVVIGILASAFLLVTYYILATKYCRRRRRRQGHRDRITGDARISTANEASRQINGGRASGLDELIVRSISVYKYRRGEGLVDGTDCSVCLSEFEENESLRLLPKCNHAFHLPCIDTWFKSHSSCPLCRSNVALAVASLPPAQPSPPAAPHQVRPAAVHSTNSHAYSHLTDAPDHRRILVRDEAVISLFCDSGSVSTSKDPSLGILEGARRSARLGRGVPPEVMRRSVSLNTWLCGHAGASTSSDQNPIANGNVPLSIGIGSSGPNGSESDVAIGSTNNFPSAGPPEMRRSISAGRFQLGSCGPGRTWATPCPVENMEK